MAELGITAKDGGQFTAYVARPRIEPAPALVLIQEIFGVNQVMRDLADDYAAQGYLVICPDLFWRIEPGIQLTDKTEAEWSRAMELFESFNVTLGVADLIATLAVARSLDGSTGHAGTLGYCLGGQLAFLMATRSNADCNVSYYGVGIEALIGEASAITKPLLMHIAGNDKYASPEIQTEIIAALSKTATATLYRYDGLDHAFARPGGQHYDAAGAALAETRTLDFLRGILHPASAT